MPGAPKTPRIARDFVNLVGLAKFSRHCSAKSRPPKIRAVVVFSALFQKWPKNALDAKVHVPGPFWPEPYSSGQKKKKGPGTCTFGMTDAQKYRKRAGTCSYRQVNSTCEIYLYTKVPGKNKPTHRLFGRKLDPPTQKARSRLSYENLPDFR